MTWSSPDALQLWFDLAAADYAKKTDAELAAKLAAADATPTAVASPTRIEGWTAAIAAAAGRIYATTGRRADTSTRTSRPVTRSSAWPPPSPPVFLATGPANLASGELPVASAASSW